MNKVDSEYSAEKILLEVEDKRFPFKPFMTDFIPATEIFASISSNSIIEYKVRFFFYQILKLFFCLPKFFNKN